MKHLFSYHNNWYLLDSDSLSLHKINSKKSTELNLLTDSEIKNINTEMNASMSWPAEEKLSIADSLRCERLILNLAEACNLGCAYCYAGQGEYYSSESNKLMTIGTVKNAVQDVLKIYPEGIEMVQFFGGEPLLNRETLQLSVHYINKVSEDLGIRPPIYTMVTNGTLLTQEDFEFFNEYFTSITISLDGEKEITDKQRPFKRQENSVYDAVRKNIELFNQNNRRFKIGLQSTINDLHIEKMRSGKSKSYEDLNALGIDSIHISPVIKAEEEKYTNVQDYIRFFEDWVEKEFHKEENINLHVLGNLLHQFTYKEKCGSECGALKSDVAISANGDMYPCFMFIGLDDFLIKNVNVEDLGWKEKLNEKRKTMKEIPSDSKCYSCWANTFCSSCYGHCIGARYMNGKDIHRPVDEFCLLTERVVETASANMLEKWVNKNYE